MAKYVNLGALHMGNCLLGWNDFDVVALDVETTGFGNSDRIVEVGITRHRPTGLRGPGYQPDSFGTLVQPGIPIPYKTTAITGITTADVADAPVFGEIAGRVQEILTGRVVIVGHAIDFDLRLLSGELARVGVHLPLPFPSVCTAKWAAHLNAGGGSNKLGDVCERYGVDTGRAHRAEDDARASFECWRAMLKDERERLGYLPPLAFKRPPFVGSANQMSLVG